jgi:tetratricopeptide (TPR) repeat protein
MAKNKPSQKPMPKQPVKPVTPAMQEKEKAKKDYSISGFRMQAIILAAIGFIFYFNSFFNEIAFDDNLLIVRNEYVKEGFSGIPKILTSDAYESYFTQQQANNQLSGGRYRPLSIVTFAVEQQIFGRDADSSLTSMKSVEGTATTGGNIMQVMHIRHVVNVLLYMLSVVALLYFFRTIVFKNYPVAAFIAALLFAIHPIHTEVVANVKSRDEIMSLLFLTLTFIYAWKYDETKKLSTLVVGLLFYFMALLSKEYGATLLILLPLMFYIFKGYNIGKSFKASLPFIGVLALYILIHLKVVALKGEGTGDIMNDPYLFATAGQRLATKIATLLNYLKLLVFPHPLSADYSYSQIAYKDFSSPLVWLSIVVHLGLVGLGIYYFRKRHVLCFAIAFYLLNLLLISNFIFDIGATMGERLIYHSSVGFVIAVAYLLYRLYEKTQPAATAQKAIGAILVVATLLCGFKIIERNADWKNDTTLFIKDVQTVPNSVLANENAAVGYMSMGDKITDTSAEGKQRRNAFYKQALPYFDKALALNPKYEMARMNRGLAYYNLSEVDKARADWDSVKKHAPNYGALPGLYRMLAGYYIVQGYNLGGQNKLPEAIIMLKKGLEVDPENADVWYNLGGAYFTMKDYPNALMSFQRAVQLRPNFTEAQQGLNALQHMAAQNTK